MPSFEELFETIDRLSSQEYRYALKKLQKESAWVRKQLHLQEGDKFRITAAIDTNNGWSGYGEAFRIDATGVIQEIYLYNNIWRAYVTLDKEWVCSTESFNKNGVTRWWHGKVEDTPTWCNPPSKYDQETYPEGRKHTFTFNLDWIEKVNT